MGRGGEGGVQQAVTPGCVTQKAASDQAVTDVRRGRPRRSSDAYSSPPASFFF